MASEAPGARSPARPLAHAPTHSSTASRDGRSVGELLLDADYLARQLLMDVSGDHAAGMLRTWGQVVDEAATLWATIPGLEPHSPNPMPQLVSVTDHLNTSVDASPASTQRWPGPGPADARLTEIAATFTRAAALVDRHGREVPHRRPEIRDDITAARTHILHTLYVTAHGVGVALHEHGRDLQRASRSTPRPLPLSRRYSPYAVAGTGGWIKRITACENTAGRYLGNRFSQAVQGEILPPPDEPGRLSQALATWDIQAHRALTDASTAANLVLVSRTQALIAGAAAVLGDAAAQTGQLLDERSRGRVLTALEASGNAWTQLASRWSDLAAPGARLDPQLAKAAGEVRAAFRELTHDKATLATTDVIAARTDLGPITHTLRGALIDAVDIADLAKLAAETPGLTGPARALSIRAHDDTERAIARRERPDHDVVWVTPQDVMANRLIPIPQPAAQGLLNASTLAAEATVGAMSAATELTSVAAIVQPTTEDGRPNRRQQPIPRGPVRADKTVGPTR